MIFLILNLVDPQMKMKNYFDLIIENGIFVDVIDKKLANGIYVNINNVQTWFKNGKCHNDDGPAVIYVNGTKNWQQNGEYYRENDLPHIEHANGEKYWWCNGWHKTLEEYLLAKVMT